MKNPLTIVSGFLSYSCKLVIFEFQPVAHVDAVNVNEYLSQVLANI